MNIPKFDQLVARVPGIAEVLQAPPEVTLVLWNTCSGMNEWAQRQITAGELRALLEGCTYDEHYPGWIIVFPGEFDEKGACYQGIYDGGSEYYKANILEADFQI